MNWVKYKSTHYILYSSACLGSLNNITPTVTQLNSTTHHNSRLYSFFLHFSPVILCHVWDRSWCGTVKCVKQCLSPHRGNEGGYTGSHIIECMLSDALKKYYSYCQDSVSLVSQKKSFTKVFPTNSPVVFIWIRVWSIWKDHNFISIKKIVKL